MKTYFKSTYGSVKLMIDSDNSKLILTQYGDKSKLINVVTDTDSYNRIVTDSTDIEKWVSSDEETFNSILSQVTANL
jgi:hypothetical protein